MKPLLPGVLALDLDGTVLTKDFRISDRTVAAVAAARAAGMRLVVTTGRSREAALPWIGRLGGAEGAVCYNGAATYETGTDGLPLPAPFALSLLPEEGARGLVALSRRLGIHFHAFRGADWLFEHSHPETERYELRSGFAGLRVDFDRIDPLSFIKAMFLGPDASLAEARREALALGLDAFGSGHGLLEVVAPGVDKARGLGAWLAARGLRMEEVLAFGDADNDEALLRAAGTGVAMGNAPEEMRRRVGRVAGSVDEEGVAAWLEDFLAAQPSR